jgi:anthranilate phosphoribosyltransferase
MEYQEAVDKFELLFQNKMTQEEAREFLVELYNKDETIDEITAAVDVMKKYSIKLDIDDSLKDKLIDIVGTGGDKSGSFNISSTVALLLSSIGCYVAKHGNRSITSKSGSADMLEELGIRLDLDIQKEKRLLEETGFTFLFAQNHHPAMKHIMPIRKSIPHRTIFNILGPLTNPADVKKEFMGVYDIKFVNKLINVLKNTGVKSAVVASSYDGLDEISISDKSFVSILKDNKISEFDLDPTDFGLKLSSMQSIKGASAKDNAKITYSILNNELDGAKRDIVLLNASAGLIANGTARDFKDGIEMAKEAILSKKAISKLQQIIKVSQGL